MAETVTGYVVSGPVWHVRGNQMVAQIEVETGCEVVVDSRGWPDLVRQRRYVTISADEARRVQAEWGPREMTLDILPDD
jgi:hypothetical protein